MPITCKELTHVYNADSPFPYAALNEVNLEIKEGVFTAIIGETGSGKSTLVQHFNALLLPSDGEVNIDEFKVTSNKNENQIIGSIESEKTITEDEFAWMMIENSDEPYANEIAQVVMREIRAGKKVDTTTRLRELIEKALIRFCYSYATSKFAN